jgi:hypothetical protein
MRFSGGRTGYANQCITVVAQKISVNICVRTRSLTDLRPKCCDLYDGCERVRDDTNEVKEKLAAAACCGIGIMPIDS